MAMPRQSTVCRILSRHKRKTQEEGNDLPPIPTDVLFAIPGTYQHLVLHDCSPAGDRLISLDCDELLDRLARLDTWIADGTFKVVPELFFQLYFKDFILVVLTELEYIVFF